MTPEELIKQRKQRELLAKAAQAKTTAPTDAEKLVSDATKENLKTAGRLAARFGKALAGKTKQAAAVAAEKGREAQEALARRAEEAKAKKESEAAAHSAPEPLTAQPDPRPSTPEPGPPHDVHARAPVADTAPVGSSVDAASVAAEIVVHPWTAEPSPPIRREPKAMVVSSPTLEQVTVEPSASSTPAVPAAQKELGPRQSTPAQQASTTPQQGVTRAGWHRIALAGGAVLIVGGVLAWWLAFRPSAPALDPVLPSATVAPASVSAPKVEPPMPAPAQSREPVKPASAPEEEQAVLSVPMANDPKSGAAIRPQRPALPVAPAPRPVAAPSPRPVPKPMAVAPVATPPEVERRTDWHEQANSDIDAWAEKIR